jgi:dipeptide transport system substrate-binding protein
MQQIAHDEMPTYYIAHSVVFEATTKNVVGYKISPFGRHEFYGVEIQ